VQDWLVAFHGEDVLPVAGQDLFDWAASRFPDSWLVAILRCGLPI
jgi:hypothetical protein